MPMIPNKFNGYQRDGRRVYPLDLGGDEQPQQTSSTQTVNNVNIPEYARPYVEDMLGRSQALTTQNPYQSYAGQRVAGFNPLQQASFQSAAGMQVAPQIGQATGMAGDVFGRAQAVSAYNPNTNFSAGDAPSQVGTNWDARNVNTNFDARNVAADPRYLQNTSTDMWNGGAAQQYMNPYMQQVVDIQKREAARQSNIQGQYDSANATKVGAFGGSRDAIVQSERERNLGQQLNDIQAQGANQAWQQAQAMFTADQGRGLQSQMANQGANLAFGQQYLSGQMANQQRDLGLNQQRLGAEGMNQQRDLALNSQDLQGQTANQRAGLDWNSQRLTAQQLGEQSRQFGAQLGLSGLQAQLGAAGLMGTLGQNQYNQQLGIAGLQNQFGLQMQGTQQAALDAQYQDFQNAQNWPYRQLEFQNSMIRGLPIAQGTTSMYASSPGPSPLSQLAGAGVAAYGMSRMAEGGKVEDSVDDVDFREIEPHVQGIQRLLISQIQ